MNEDLKPARQTNVKMPTAESESSDEIFAVCLKTDDTKLLIPFKVYRINLRGKYACLIDEKGDAAVYSSNFFLPLLLPSETIDTLSSAYSHYI